MKTTYEKDENAIREEVETELKQQFDKDIQIRIKMADEEKSELYIQIKELQENLDKYNSLVCIYYDQEVSEISENTELFK